MSFLYLAIISALIGIIPMPYVGYMLVRIGVTLGCVLAICTLPKKTYAGVSSTVWLVIISILYNPIFPLYLNRGAWIILDLVVASLIFGILLANKGTINNPNEVKTTTTQSKTAENPLDNEINSSDTDLVKLIEKKGDEFAKSLILYSIALIMILGFINLLLA